MIILKYTIYAIVILTSFPKAFGKENANLCEEIVTAETDDGRPYHYNVFVCCAGYTPDNSGKCIPICSIPCTFGICVAPNVCDCKDGYKMKQNKCVPKCSNKCINGYCSKPEVCGCPNGFELNAKNSTLCTPVCNPKCPNFSKCTKSIPPNPNRCQCIMGYRENKTTKTCEPVCKSKCTNGYCSAPDTCACAEGYELDSTNKTNCIPKCEPKCPSYSSCIAPSKCECNEGYRLNKKTEKCDPICRDKIKNSRCIEPPNTWVCIENYQHDRKIDKCVLESCLCGTNGYCEDYRDKCECYEGFTKNITTGQCDPKCEPSCVNSICVANNVCQCLDDYHKTTEYHHICEENGLCDGQPCLNGECLISGECKCKFGFVKSFSYNGQHQCDKVQTFVRKIMTTILGLPLLLASCVLIAVYVIAKKKSYNVEEQEMVLIGSH